MKDGCFLFHHFHPFKFGCLGFQVWIGLLKSLMGPSRLEWPHFHISSCFPLKWAWQIIKVDDGGVYQSSFFLQFPDSFIGTILWKWKAICRQSTCLTSTCIRVERSVCYLRWIGYRPLVMESLKIVPLALQCFFRCCWSPVFITDMSSIRLLGGAQWCNCAEGEVWKRRNEEDSDWCWVSRWSNIKVLSSFNLVIKNPLLSSLSSWIWSQDFEAPQREALSAAVRENLQKFPVEMQARLVFIESLDV